MSIPSNSKARTISEETIEPIVSGTDTVMYLVNYSDGWCLFSGDKRTEAILAYSETGHLSLKDIGNMEGFSYWFTRYKRWIKKIKEDDRL
ncbi:MAG: Spi family protease inhibitor [Parabacteroides sp.]|nr:Spi family protease inhibitor [Parabacteroides sp.]